MARPKKTAAKAKDTSKNNVSKSKIVEESRSSEEEEEKDVSPLSTPYTTDIEEEQDPEEEEEEEEEVEPAEDLDNDVGGDDEEDFKVLDKKLDLKKAKAIIEKYPVSVKLELMAQVRNINKRKTLALVKATNHLDWSKIKIGDYKPNEMKQCFLAIMKVISRMRTLDEMIADYETHYKKIEFKIDNAAPKLPRNACMVFINGNRERLIEMYKKENPSQDDYIPLSIITKYGSHVFKNVISDTERAQYQEAYVDSLKEYKKKKLRFLKDHPELAHKRTDTYKKQKLLRDQRELAREAVKPKEPAKKKKRKECAYITPYMVFRESLMKEGRNVAYHDSCALYKALTDEEKLKYIRELVNLETDREKQFSKSEQKILKFCSGLPKKPLSAYNTFVRDLSLKLGKPPGIVKIAPAQWKSLDPEKKAVYEETFYKELDKWQKNALAWVMSQPKEQQAELLAKHGLLQKVDRTGAKRRRQSIFVGNDVDEPPVKKKQKSKAADDATPVEAKKEFAEKASIKITNIRQESPEKETVKVTKTGEKATAKGKKSSEKSPVKKSAKSSTKTKEEPESSVAEASPIKKEKKEKKPKQDDLSFLQVSSPKKSKFKELIATLGPYPSLSVPHYFMAEICKDKPPNKVKKAYGKLSRMEKKTFLNDVNKKKMAYFKKLRDFAETETKYAQKIAEFHKKSSNEQQESVRDWHKPTDTDKESSDESSDSDTDSD